MKKVVQFAVATAAVIGATSVQAAPSAVVSSTSADLYLFVQNTATKQTFVEDTGIAINTLVPAGSVLPSGSTVVGGVITKALATNQTVAGNTALANFIAAAGSNIQYTVEAGEDPGAATAGKCGSPGSCITIDANNSSAANNAQQTLSSVVNWLTGLETDSNTYTAAGLQVGGSIVLASSAGAWGNTLGGGAGSTNQYGNGPNSAGIAVGTAENVYAYTSNGGAGNAQSYSLGQALLASDGTLTIEGSAGTTSAVPLPAGVWLIGSGLLGLAGIGRRRREA